MRTLNFQTNYPGCKEITKNILILNSYIDIITKYYKDNYNKSNTTINFYILYHNAPISIYKAFILYSGEMI